MTARRASCVLLRALRLRLALARSVAVGAALAFVAACGITTGPSGAGAAADGGGEAPSGEAGPGGAPRTDGGDDAGAAASDGGPAVDAATPGCDCTPVWVAVGELYPSDVAVDATYVYWTEHPGDQVVPAASARAALLRMPLAGGPRVELASARATSVSLALHGGAVYWGRWGGASGGGSGTLADGALLRTTRAGVTATVLDGMAPARIAASDAAVCWTAARWITFGGLGDVICLLG